MSVATMSTNHGDITIELFDEDAPKTVQNFKDLAAKGYGSMLAALCPRW